MKILGVILVVTLPIRSTLIAVSLLVMADLITGMWASLKEGRKITSTRLRRTVVKTLAYQSAIVVAFLLETYLISDMPIVKVVSGLIGLTEGKSFFENLRRITGIDFWGQILSKLNMPENDKIQSDKDAK